MSLAGTPVSSIRTIAPRRTRPIAVLAHAAMTMALAAHAAGAHAQLSGPAALIDQQHCLFCHTNGAPFLAPSFHQIAERYRNTPDAGTMLEQKLRLGGKAHWGDTAMPPSAERSVPLSERDARTLVQWVLSQ